MTTKRKIQGKPAVRVRLRELMTEKGRIESRTIRVSTVIAETGLPYNTAHDAYLGTLRELPLHVAEKLCRYFHCEPASLLAWAASEEE